MNKDNKVIAAELTAKILAGSFNDISAKEDRARIIAECFSILFSKILEELETN